MCDQLGYDVPSGSGEAEGRVTSNITNHESPLVRLRPVARCKVIEI